uniref:Metalloendopeptidase n=1 Tax=Eptatretus burgeri TaxID=7764 RepID=A0A8C4QPQ7_EPTBU
MKYSHGHWCLQAFISISMYPAIRRYDDQAIYDMSEKNLNAKGIILQAFDMFRLKSCIDFVPWTGEQDYLSVVKAYGCWSYVGKQRGPQTLSIGYGCDDISIVEHELLHLLGFWHEQSRTDRDDYVIIQWTNIEEDRLINFEKNTLHESDSLNVSYDYLSVMHYNSKAFQKAPGLNTIITKDPHFMDIIGQRLDISELDRVQLNRMYSCSELLKTLYVHHVKSCCRPLSCLGLFTLNSFCLNYKSLFLSFFFSQNLFLFIFKSSSSIYSPRFNSTDGYSFQLSMYPNVRQLNNKSIGLFVHLTSGYQDDELQWPCPWKQPPPPPPCNLTLVASSVLELSFTTNPNLETYLHGSLVFIWDRPDKIGYQVDDHGSTYFRGSGYGYNTFLPHVYLHRRQYIRHRDMCMEWSHDPVFLSCLSLLSLSISLSVIPSAKTWVVFAVTVIITVIIIIIIIDTLLHLFRPLSFTTRPFRHFICNR